jgi:hypothetical protein
MFVVGQLESDDHSRPSPDRLFGVYEETSGAYVGHMLSDPRRTAAAVGELEFHLGAYGGTLETSSFKLRGTSHCGSFLRLCLA